MNPSRLVLILAALTLSACSPAATLDMRGDTIYMIMVDRFCDGNPANNTVGNPNQYSPDHTEWGKYFGGDLSGITQKLDYLKTVGATALWITPVCQNDPYLLSNGTPYHGYDMQDFYRVEPHFGDWAAFDALTEGLRSRGMKLVLDVNLNNGGYTGSGNLCRIHKDGVIRADYNRDYQGFYHHLGAMRDDKWEDPYWMLNANIFGMADLNQDNPLVRRYLLSAVAKWVWHGVDAFRLDAAKHVPVEFMRAFTDEMNRFAGWLGRPGAYAFAEYYGGGAWNQASIDWANQAGTALFDFHLAGDIRDVMLEYKSFNDLWNNIQYRQTAYGTDAQGEPNSNWQVIWFDSHDWQRMMTVLLQRYGGNQAAARNRVDQCIVLTLTLPGIPCIYYGTEQYLHNDSPGTGGIPGADPYNRPMMESWDTNTSAAKTLAALSYVRKNNPALRFGDIQQRYITSSLFCYSRQWDQNAVVVALNNAGVAQDMDVANLPLPNGSHEDVLHPGTWVSVSNGWAHFHLEPTSSCVLVRYQTPPPGAPAPSGSTNESVPGQAGAQLIDREIRSRSHVSGDSVAVSTRRREMAEQTSATPAPGNGIAGRSEVSASGNGIAGRSEVSAPGNGIAGRSEVSASGNGIAGRSEVSAPGNGIAGRSEVSASGNGIAGRSEVSASGNGIAGRSEVSASGNGIAGRSPTPSPLAGEAPPTPSPLAGEGWGEGETTSSATTVAARSLLGAIPLDGRNIPTDFAGSLVATQDNFTWFGDSGHPGGGSELDQLFVGNHASALKIGITGNLETNGNSLLVFLQTAPEGTSTLSATAGPPSGVVGSLQGTMMDEGFSPNWLLVINAYNGVFYADLVDLVNNTTRFLGSGSVNSGAGSLTGGTNPNGAMIGFDNSNTAGVTSDPARSIAQTQADAATASTGFEISLPFADVNLCTGKPRIMALITGSGGYISNQSLPGFGGKFYNPGMPPIDFDRITALQFAQVQLAGLSFPNQASIAATKALPLASPVALTDQVVTGQYYPLSSYYIESPDRTSGVRVRDTSGYLPSQGRTVNVYGFVTSEGGERIINANSTVIGANGTIPAPLGMAGASVGGSSVPGAVGLSNNGILVTVWGRVTDRGLDENGSDFFYVDDGSGLWDGTYRSDGRKRPGVRVTISYVYPDVGSFVRVTGVSSVQMIDGVPRRRILPRGALDVRTQQEQ